MLLTKAIRNTCPLSTMMAGGIHELLSSQEDCWPEVGNRRKRRVRLPKKKGTHLEPSPAVRTETLTPSCVYANSSLQLFLD